MKNQLKIALAGITAALFLFLAPATYAQRTQNEKSPPKFVSQKVGDLMIRVEYNAPSVRNRTIGKDLEPMPDKVWRTGADSATSFIVSKDVKVNGQPLAKGRYGLFSIPGDKEWTIIFNKNYKQWGAFRYDAADDVLRVNAKVSKAPKFAEQMEFTVSPKGLVTLLWGDNQVEFNVE